MLKEVTSSPRVANNFVLPTKLPSPELIVCAIGLILIIGGIIALALGGPTDLALNVSGEALIGMGLACAILAIFIRYFPCRKQNLHNEYGLQPDTCCGRYANDSADNWCWTTYNNVATLYSLGGFQNFTPPVPPGEIYNPQSMPEGPGIKLGWIGHAGWELVIEREGQPVRTLLIDPNWSKSIPPVICGDPVYTRDIPPGITEENTPKADAVLISHTHGDHCDPPSLTFLKDRDNPLFFFPNKTGARFRANGFEKAQNAEWGHTFEVPDSGIRLTFMPAHHSSQTNLLDCQRELWGNWVIQIPDRDSFKTFVFLCDTALNIDPTIPGHLPQHYKHDRAVIEEMHQHFPDIDHLFVGVDPNRGQEDMHSNHLQTIAGIRILQPKHVHPAHYGTFPFNNEPPQNNGKLLNLIRAFIATYTEENENDPLPELVVMKTGEWRVY